MPFAAPARLLRRLVSALAAPALTFALACASAPPPAPPAPHETGRLVFWEVHHPQGGTAHLLGTVHVGRGTMALDPAIGRASARPTRS